MRGLGAAADVRREEWPFAASMAAVFFLVISTFWILKPLKKSLFVQFYDRDGLALFGATLDAAQAELLAKVMNMVVAAIAVVVFSALSLRLRRERLVLFFDACFVVGFGVFALALADPGAFAVWSFYLYGDLFTTLMVAAFFAFLNDSVSEDAAKRLYGLVGVGGVTGGVVGASLLATWIEDLSVPQWLGVCAVAGVLIALGAVAAGRSARRLPQTVERSRREEAESPSPSRFAALRGARLALGSRYLLSVIAIVGVYEIASTIMDFQFSSTVQHYLDGDAIGVHFSRVYAVTNAASLLVQLCLTSFVMTRFGVGVALLVLPAAALASSSAFLAIPSLWTGSALNTADGAFAYSINQSAKESLYVPTTAEEKYEAKAFIDMWVQRFAKAIAVVLSLGITLWFQDFSTVRWISLATLALLAIWIPAARYAGRRFDRSAR
jgi:ATP:ADP antiporter, AAA family